MRQIFHWKHNCHDQASEYVEQTDIKVSAMMRIPTKPLVPVTVITTCYNRNQHLFNLLNSLEVGSCHPAEVIVVNDDVDQNKLANYDLNIIQIATEASERPHGKSNKFDIGLNRNKGAAEATNDMLIFLDVDCIVSTYFIEGIHAKLEAYPQALLMGQPLYLTRPLSTQESQALTPGHTNSANIDEWLFALAIVNPHRPNFAIDARSLEKCANQVEKTDDYGAFWSLCFAISNTCFHQIGGFDTQYVGYGAEDTDVAFRAREMSIAFYLTADVVYHQQHAVYRPPLNHLSSIVVNANLFYNRWQHWPMSGWLQEFSLLGLIDWTLAQTHPIAILRQPSEHEQRKAYCPDAPFV